MTTKQKIWNHIKERTFDLPYQKEIFHLIETHLDRIEFVRDHIGLRDFLFLAEEAAKGYYTSELFIAINVDVSKRNNMRENNEQFTKKVNDDPIEVLKELKSFFLDTGRTLYLGIGFVETINSDLREKTVEVEDIEGNHAELSLLDVTIIRGIQTGKYKSPEEAMKDLRQFPEWYENSSAMPEEVSQITIEEEEEIKRNQRQSKIKAYTDEINKALDQKDKDSFMKFSKLLNELQNAN